MQEFAKANAEKCDFHASHYIAQGFGYRFLWAFLGS